jgi:NADH:ubiquinone oxidoreductase subunit 3 (subunit A)
MGKGLPIIPTEHPWVTIVVLLLAAFVFGAIPLSLAWLWAKFFSPAKPGLQKNATYECGLEAQGDSWLRMDVSYYVYAIVFLVFDVEAVFLLPFAAAFSGLSMAACLAMLVFLLLLVEGLVWACQKGALTWA